ncbi:MAG: hypothetical protein FJ404_08570 [Verrucomicrobia bacterium]|nr:hypothetical protein [Verrucomicrobiota bacterium]
MNCCSAIQEEVLDAHALEGARNQITTTEKPVPQTSDAQSTGFEMTEAAMADSMVRLFRATMNLDLRLDL